MPGITGILDTDILTVFFHIGDQQYLFVIVVQAVFGDMNFQRPKVLTERDMLFH